jgi:hypothetical protein
MAQITSNSTSLPEAPCTHAIPDSLAPKLPKPHTCPSCIVRQHILTIQDVQRKFEDRGGAFRSKEGNHGQHRAIRKVWREAKIALSNTIAKFEELLEEGHLPVQANDKLREALNVWDRKKVVLGRVPGVAYVEGSEEVEPSEEDKEGARLMMVLLNMLVEKLDQEEDAKGGATPTIPQPVRKGTPTEMGSSLYRPWKTSPAVDQAASTPMSLPFVVRDTPQTPLQPLRAAPTSLNAYPRLQEDPQQLERTVLATLTPSPEPLAEASSQPDRTTKETLGPARQVSAL